MIVYKLTNKANGMVYIGQTTKTIQSRMRCHRSNRQRSMPIQIAIAEYGEDNFLKEILCTLDCRELLDNLEDYFISAYDSTNPEKGYNKKTGGKNGTYSKEMAEKMSNRMKGNKICTGRKQSEESLRKTRKKIICVETGDVYPGINVAAFKLGLWRQNICHVLNGKLRATGGYTFKRVE